VSADGALVGGPPPCLRRLASGRRERLGFNLRARYRQIHLTFPFLGFRLLGLHKERHGGVICTSIEVQNDTAVVDPSHNHGALGKYARFRV
jgi:hypothetical protein